MSSSKAAPKLLFVTGKGGVGKSSVALAYAMRFAEQGYRTLLVEMSYHSYFSDFLSLPELGYEPREIRPNLSAACWSGEACLREYVLHYLKLERMYRLFFENRIMKSLLNVAPGLKEISLLGKITSGNRHVGPDLKFERVVVDCFATGHALAFFRAPKGLAEAIQVGPMGEQSRSIDRVLRDPDISSYTVVSLFEELPVTETEELVAKLKEDLGVTAQVIVNKVLQSPVKTEALEIEPGDFAQYLRDALARQKEFKERLKKSTGLAAELPLTFERDPWQMATQLKKALPEEALPKEALPHDG